MLLTHTLVDTLLAQLSWGNQQSSDGNRSKSDVPAAGREPEPCTPLDIEACTLSYLPFVRTLARRVYRRLPPGTSVELRDLVQAGILGLVNAARSYDPATGVSLSSFAQYRIRGEMLDTLRGLDGVSRQLRRFDK